MYPKDIYSGTTGGIPQVVENCSDLIKCAGSSGIMACFRCMAKYAEEPTKANNITMSNIVIMWVFQKSNAVRLIFTDYPSCSLVPIVNIFANIRLRSRAFAVESKSCRNRPNP